MNPFECHGEMAPTDSRGQCSLNIGTVWKKVGNTCYYCAPINPPIQGFVLPLDKVASAESQGWRCGANQADLCTAVCYGGRTYSPPPGVTPTGGGPGLPPTPTPKPPQGGPRRGYAPRPGPPPVAGAANPCLPFGPGGYDYCANASGIRRPAGCVCNGYTACDARTPNDMPPSPPSDSAFAKQLLDDAQTILRNAGKISKEMTDAMDVTKHNNVGVNVAVGAYFGAAGKLLRVVAQQYKALAAAANAVAAAEKTPILKIADEATSQSTTLAGQAEEAAAQIAKTGGGGPGSLTGGTAAGKSHRLTCKRRSELPGRNCATKKRTLSYLLGQGKLPVCAVLSCARISRLLGADADAMRVISSIRATIVRDASGEVVGGGMRWPEIQAGLDQFNIKAPLGHGLEAMLNETRDGNPVIVSLFSTGKSGPGPLHAIVVEGIEERADIVGLKIYDPMGQMGWWPVRAFKDFFTDDFIVPRLQR